MGDGSLGPVNETKDAMTAQRTVVVTDVTSPHRFLSCLSAVARTVDASVEVVAVSTRSVALPKPLARRVRKVRVARDSSIADAVAAEAVRPALVVVLTSDTRVAGSWLARLEESVAPMPHCVGVLGGRQARVLVFGDRVRSTQAQEVQLPDVPDLSWPQDSAEQQPLQVMATAGRASEQSAAGAQHVTLTAALIVKDEEDVLAECLDAVRAEVDEVVVYDTGSTDGTVALAEAHGARVIRGHWDDDFAAARNRLLEHCTTDWVLSLDADEVIQSAPGALRARLVGEQADLVLVPVVSTTWSAADDGDEHRPARVFRRERAHWTGALHETLVSRADDALVLAHAAAPVRLLHSGYQGDRMASKDKRARNLDIARAQVESLTAASTDAEGARAWTNYGRALVSAGRVAEGLDALAEIIELAGNRSEMVQAARVALSSCLQLPRLEAFDTWLDVARRYGEAPGALALWRARLLLHHGDLDGALHEIDQATSVGGVDPWGVPFDPDDVVGTRARVLSRQGEDQAALDLLLDLLRRRQEKAPFADLVQAAVNAGYPLADLVSAGGPQFLARSLRDAVQLPGGAADQWLDALWLADPQPSVLVAGSVVAPRLPMDGVLKWSLRVRERGLNDLCPLRAMGYDVERPAAERCLALAILGDALGEQDALVAFDHVAADLPDDETSELLTALARYAPGLVVEPTAAVGAVS